MRVDLMRRIGMSVGMAVLACSIAMAVSDHDQTIGFFAFVGAALLGISIPPIVEQHSEQAQA
jgi:hypothetical protein